MFDKFLFKTIQNKKVCDWNYDFCDDVYNEVAKNKIYITNLAKATQLDARPLPNNIFEKYLDLLKEEIGEINPKIIISFGNQVSSVLLNEKINVSKWRKKSYNLEIKNKKYTVYPVYYPAGIGTRNIKKVLEDLNWIIRKEMNI